MPILSATELTALRERRHRSSVQLTAFHPDKAYFMEVDGAHARGATTITFKDGVAYPPYSWSDIEALQTAWIPVSSEATSEDRLSEPDWIPLRIKGTSSGDGGVTGTIDVAVNGLTLVDDQDIIITMDYRFDTMYPDIDAVTEEFYKDVDVSYPGSSNAIAPPVAIVELSHDAGFFRNGRHNFYVNMSNSYAMADGASIASYSLSVIPNTGEISATFDTGTGFGWITITGTTRDHFWLKCSVTDSNAITETTYRLIHIHDPDTDLTPVASGLIDEFVVNTVTGDWDDGGWEAEVTILEDSDFEVWPDNSRMVLWKENQWSEIDANPFCMSDGYKFTHGELTFPDSVSAVHTNDVQYQAVVINEFGAPITSLTGLGDFYYDNGGGWTGPVATVSLSGGVVTTLVNANPTVGQEWKWAYEESPGVYVEVGSRVFQRTYDGHGDQLGIAYLSFPQTMINGYTRQENHEWEEGVLSTTVTILTINGIMNQEFMYSVPVTATESPSAWEEYATWLTTSRAAHYFLRWHSTLLQVANVYGLMDDTTPDEAVDFEPGTIYEMVDDATYQKGIRHHLVCNKSGDMALVHDMQLMTDSEFSGLSVGHTITSDDLAEPIVAERFPYARTALVRVSGLAWDGTTFVDVVANDDTVIRTGDAQPYCSLATWYKPSRGGEDLVNFDNQRLDDQAHANAIAGRIFARDNNPYPEIPVIFNGDYSDWVDFHEVYPWKATISEEWMWRVPSSDVAYPRERTFDLILRHIEIDVDEASGRLVSNISFETRAEGIGDGIAAGCPEVPDDFDTGDSSGGDPDPLPDPGGDTGIGTGLGDALAQTGGAAGVTNNINGASTNWADSTDLGMSNMVGTRLDPFDPDTAFVLSSDGEIWRTDDWKSGAAATWTQKLTQAALVAGTGVAFGDMSRFRGPITSIRSNGWIGFAFNDVSTSTRPDTWFVYSNDGGDTWNYVLAYAYDTGANTINGKLGAITTAEGVEGSVVVYMVHGACDFKRLNKSTDGGATWNWVGSWGDWDIPKPPSCDGNHCSCVHVPYEDNPDGDIIYAGFQNRGITVSVDGGTTWTEISPNGVGGGGTIFPRGGIESYTGDRQRMFCWINSGSPGNSSSTNSITLWVSNDAGQTWSSVGSNRGPVRASGGFPSGSPGSTPAGYEQIYYLKGNDAIGSAFQAFYTLDRGSTWTEFTGDWAFGQNGTSWGFEVDWTAS